MNMHSMRSLPYAVLMLVAACMTATAMAADRKQAPDFELPDMNGAMQKLSAHQGTVVVLNFWATWCPECITEIASLNRFTDQYRDKGVTVLSVSVDKSEAALRSFLSDIPVHYPVMLDNTGDVFVRKYLIRGLPATVVIDSQGFIAAKLLGAQEFDTAEFTKRIDGLLGQRP